MTRLEINNPNDPNNPVVIDLDSDEFEGWAPEQVSVFIEAVRSNVTGGRLLGLQRGQSVEKIFPSVGKRIGRNILTVEAVGADSIQTAYEPHSQTSAGTYSILTGINQHGPVYGVVTPMRPK